MLESTGWNAETLASGPRPIPDPFESVICAGPRTSLNRKDFMNLWDTWIIYRKRLINSEDEHMAYILLWLTGPIIRVLKEQVKLLKKMKLMVFITAKPSSLAWIQGLSSVTESSPLKSPALPSSRQSHFHSSGAPTWGHWQPAYILATKQSHRKGTVLYKRSFKFPGKTSMTTQVTCPIISKSHRPGLGLCSQEPEKFCPI